MKCEGVRKRRQETRTETPVREINATSKREAFDEAKELYGFSFCLQTRSMSRSRHWRPIGTEIQMRRLSAISMSGSTAEGYLPFPMLPLKANCVLHSFR